MLRVGYKLEIGGWSVDSAADPRTELVGLETRLAMGSPTDGCRLEVFAPPAPRGGLVGPAAGAAAGALGGGGGAAFSVAVRGEAVEPGDRLTVELTAGERSAKAVTAEVQAVRSTLGRTDVFGATGAARLARARLNRVYENQTLRQIADDLAGQAGVQSGGGDTGSTYPYLVVDESRSVGAHLHALARRDGLDLYFDPDNQLHLRRFDKSSADHSFHYGIDILDLKLFNGRATSARVKVSGESPASQQGNDTWPWLAKDLSPFQGEAGDGGELLAIHDGAVRTKAQADQLATARHGAASDLATWGRLVILGNPTVQVADAIEIKGTPKPELEGLFKVTAVRHTLRRQSGFLTAVDFSGHGGAGGPGGGLGL